MKISGSTVINLLMVVVFGGMLYLSLDLPETSRRVPLLIAIVGLALSFALLARETIRARHPSSSEEAVPKEPGRKKAEATAKREAIVSLWIFTPLGLVLVFGFWVGMPVFVFTFMRFFGHESWKLATTFAGASWVVVYLIFHVALKVSLYGGILGIAFF